MVFFCLSKLLFSGFPQFKGNFVAAQNNSKYHWVRAPFNITLRLQSREAIVTRTNLGAWFHSLVKVSNGRITDSFPILARNAFRVVFQACLERKGRRKQVKLKTIHMQNWSRQQTHVRVWWKLVKMYDIGGKSLLRKQNRDSSLFMFYSFLCYPRGRKGR